MSEPPECRLVPPRSVFAVSFGPTSITGPEVLAKLAKSKGLAKREWFTQQSYEIGSPRCSEYNNHFILFTRTVIHAEADVRNTVYIPISYSKLIPKNAMIDMN